MAVIIALTVGVAGATDLGDMGAMLVLDMTELLDYSLGNRRKGAIA